MTQVDSGLVCSLYQWGPGPWVLGVYLSSWGTTTHYSPPIMPHRAPFLCLNWGTVCAPMNYSIYLLCCSEVCLEKLAQTAPCPHVRLIVCTVIHVFSYFVFAKTPPVFTHSCDVHWIVPVHPPPCPLSAWPLYGTYGTSATQIGHVSLHSYLDSLNPCTCLSCLTKTLARRMSSASMRLNTPTFSLRPCLHRFTVCKTEQLFKTDSCAKRILQGKTNKHAFVRYFQA